jgi:pyruvate dehydrogenase E1 component beta subunit
MVAVALQAAATLAEEGIDAEVIDPRTISPLDEETLVTSVRKTTRCIVVDEGYTSFGTSAEIAAIIANRAFHELSAPVERVAAMDVPIPFNPSLEALTIPDVEQVVACARRLLGR